MRWRGIPFTVVAVLVLTASTALALAAGPATTLAQAASPEQQLADKFAPVAYLRAQKERCDRDGEGYLPAPVEVVLGNPQVALKQADGTSSAQDTIIKMGPTAQDLVGLGEDFYLDFPGNPRRPGCTFETDFKRFAAAQQIEPTAYAHIVRYPDEQQLVLQYWVWWYFNDWNNTHESDWEMVQVAFDAASVEEALTQEPVRIGFAQHGGGEAADWDDDKLRREGNHPVFFPGAGSHSTHFGQRLYIGWGENGTGFGCDNTRPPSRRTPLNVVLVPDDPDPSDPFAWLLFGGRWGERQAWEFNGPRGPQQTRNWNDPLGAMENWRSSSLSIPESRALGPTATDIFCTLSGSGSTLVLVFGDSPLVLVSIVVGVVGALVSLFIVRRRELGGAIAMYRRQIRTFAAIGALTIPIGILFNALSLLLMAIPPMDWVLSWFNDTANARLAAVTTIGALQHFSMMLVIMPPLIYAVREFQAGRAPGILQSFREGYRRIRAILFGLVIEYGTASLLLLTWFGIPFAIWLTVRWQFFGQAAILDDAPNGRSAIRMSWSVTRGRWWQALGRTLVFQVLAVLPGPLIGLTLLLLGKTTVQLANAISSVIFAVTVPISVIGVTLAYQRFKRLAAEDEAATPEAGDGLSRLSVQVRQALAQLRTRATLARERR